MAKKKIVIVEDERIVAEDIKRSLHHMGYTVSAVVSSGEEALRETKENRPDLVLMDIVLKGEMSGIEAAGQIRNDFNIPVVYLTAYADENTLDQAKITEPFGYIVKPFQDKELRSVIEMALYKYGTEEALRESEEKYRILTENSLTGIFIHQDGKYVFVNDKFSEIHGYRPQELLGKEYLTLIHPDERWVLRQLASKRLEGKAVTQRYEIRRLRKDGKTIWCEMMVTRIEYGGKPAIMGNIIDITERKRALEKLQKTLEGTIHALASAVEMKDPYTAGHQQRVAQLACAIAKEMGLSENQIEGIGMTALIHDIGKINVPAEILSKPAQLSELEFSLIRTHPKAGHDILNGAIEFPWPVAQIVLQHHERMNGSGYPQGLSGKDILLEARILAVADVVEAMASHRPYRSAHGIDKALEEISQNRGVLYDPEVVDACVRLFTEKGFKFERS